MAEKLVLSYSKLSLFSMCRKQYKLKYIDRVKPTEFVILGAVIHKILEYLAKEPKKENIERFANEIIKQGLYPYEYVQKAKNAVLSWYADYKFSNPTVGVELPFYFEIAKNVFITGAIDRIEKISDRVYKVIDYKSGYRQYGPVDLMTSLQLDIYTIAAFRLYDLDGIVLAYENINGNKNNSSVEIQRNKEELEGITERVLNQIEAVVNFVNKGDYKATLGEHCRFCTYNYMCKEYKDFLDTQGIPENASLEQLLDYYGVLEGVSKKTEQYKNTVRGIVAAELGKSAITATDFNGLRASFKNSRLYITHKETESKDTKEA